MQNELDLKALRDHLCVGREARADFLDRRTDQFAWKFILKQIEQVENCKCAEMCHCRECRPGGWAADWKCEKCSDRRADLLALQREVLR